ncbi:MAG: ABC transporter permease [Tepidisphaeraceae bacterium]|jgi:ABC-type lipoprotein release transport system permease subunit
MSTLKLLARNLWFFRWANLAVIAGLAVATAVLTGALLVGDSVRHSLTALATRRLGPVDYALVSNRCFPQDLVTRLGAAAGFAKEFSPVAAGITLRGGAAREAGKPRVADVAILAVDRWLDQKPGQAVFNAELSESLGGLRPWDTVLLSLPLQQDVPLDAALAKRGLAQITTSLRAQNAGIAPDRSMAGLFTLTGGQRGVRNAWVNLRDLQNTLEQSHNANLILIHGKSSFSPDGAKSLNDMLRSIVTLPDLGLSLSRSADGGDAILGSASTFITPPVDAVAEQVAAELKLPLRRVSTYLINNVVKLGDSPGQIHYCIAAGLSDLPGATIKDSEIAVNQWTADRLALKVGDTVRLDYYLRQPNGDLAEVRSDRPGVGLIFRVAAILPMQGLGADKSLTPIYKGLTDAESVSSWQPPAGLDIDKKLVTPEDDKYWKQHHAAPKLFVNLNTARTLWGQTYGVVNTIRLPADRADAFSAGLLRKLDPAAVGLAFTPVKARQLSAATQGTDFAELFTSFSFFLIASAVLLSAMLFRLGVEQRARQYGLLGALGFTPGRILNLALGEGAILAALGSAIGLALGVGYTALMIRGLRSAWLPAVGTRAIDLAVIPATMVTADISSFIVAMLAIVWGAWRLRQADAARLLAGGYQHDTVSHRRRRVSATLCLISSVAAVGCFAAGILSRTSAQNAFLGGGASLLVALLSFLAWEIGRAHRRGLPSHWSVFRLGLRNAGRFRARSILTASLIAFASFVLVTTAAFKQTPPEDEWKTKSGTGGFQLILSADVPLPGDPATRKGRDVLGVSRPDDPLWSASTFVPMRLWAGQDISCLNMTRPDTPTILSVPPQLVSRGAFVFSDAIQKTANPWTLLDKADAETIPVIADAESAEYILKLPLGGTLSITDALGRPQKLRLVATLSSSIFQGELLMSERNFQRLFPAQGGFARMLVQTRPADVSKVRDLIQNELEDYSVTLERTGTRLARYQEVANTYLDTFQTLGSLGLLLGTVGLAVVILRGLVERRAELALLAALGFSPGRRLGLVFSENAFLLVAGLFIGSGSALAGIWPAVTQTGSPVNLLELARTITVILGVGLLVQFATLLTATRRLHPEDLRRE